MDIQTENLKMSRGRKDASPRRKCPSEDRGDEIPGNVRLAGCSAGAAGEYRENRGVRLQVGLIQV